MGYSTIDNIVTSLVTNLAIVSILLVTWDIMVDRIRQLSTDVRLVMLGLAMGLSAALSISMSYELTSGFIVDLRASFIGAAAFFGGWLGGPVAAVIAVAFRVHQGGIGVVPGSLTIVLTCCAGIFGNIYFRRERRTLSVIVSMATLIAMTSVAALSMFPREDWPLLFGTAGPLIFFFNLVGFLIIAVLLDRQIRHSESAAMNRIYRAMVRELPDCLNMKDRKGRFLAANPATAALMSADSSTDLLGKTDFDFYPRELAESFHRDEQETMRLGEPLRIDQRTVFPDGTEGWLSTLKVPFRDQRGKIVGLITYNRDITEQKRMLLMKNEFISTVSHELRTPLTSIRGALGLITAGVAGPLPDRAASLLKIAHQNSERLVLLVNDILDMEKIESGRMVFESKKLPLRPLLEEAMAASGNYLPEKKVRLALVDDAPRSEVNVDPDRLQQVLANLLSNAIKFTADASSVTLSSKRLPDGMVRISVTDQGSGIPDEFKPRIFGKFEQADGSNTRSKGGTGLGLSIVKKIVEHLNGQISFESPPGEGATFHVDLPDFTSPAIGLQSPEAPLGRVLIIEDDNDTASILANMVDAEGYASDIAPDLGTARTLLASRQYMAATLDLVLADESGSDFFCDIHSEGPNENLPVIMISGDMEAMRATANAEAACVVDRIEKPVDEARLRLALVKAAKVAAEHDGGKKRAVTRLPQVAA